jgi:ABC-type bacteriocin/lantibiotic exporter with double-glycine peptidase domain
MQGITPSMTSQIDLIVGVINLLLQMWPILAIGIAGIICSIIIAWIDERKRKRKEKEELPTKRGE